MNDRRTENIMRSLPLTEIEGACCSFVSRYAATTEKQTDDFSEIVQGGEFKRFEIILDEVRIVVVDDLLDLSHVLPSDRLVETFSFH